MKRWYGHGYHTPLSLKLIFGIIPRLPKWTHPPIAAGTALIFFCLLKTERAAVIRNLRRVCHVGRLRLLWKTYRVFYSFCDLMVSYCYVPAASHTQLCAMLVDPDRGEAEIDRCLSLGNGLIVWTAHLGNWEFGARLLEMHGRRVNVARAVEQGNAAEMMLRDMMINDRLRIVQVNRDFFASVELLGALRQNEIVAIQGDRTYQGHFAEVTFFGEKVNFPLGPFILSYVSDAPVLPGVVVRDGWLRYRVVMGDPISLPHTGDRDRDLVAGLAQATQFLEGVIASHHCQWLNFYEFWSPPGSRGEQAEEAVLKTATSHGVSR